VFCLHGDDGIGKSSEEDDPCSEEEKLSSLSDKSFNFLNTSGFLENV
jgi:hypothetical protein